LQREQPRLDLGKFDHDRSLFFPHWKHG
jgi:hypothetical protein